MEIEDWWKKKRNSPVPGMTAAPPWIAQRNMICATLRLCFLAKSVKISIVCTSWCCNDPPKLLYAVIAAPCSWQNFTASTHSSGAQGFHWIWLLATGATFSISVSSCKWCLAKLLTPALRIKPSSHSSSRYLEGTFRTQGQGDYPQHWSLQL